MSIAPALPLTAAHRRRLRELWRSAGWPSHDLLEVELLAAGLVQRRTDPQGRETLRVTDAGVQVLAAARHRHRSAFDAHEALVERVAREMQRAGRVVWRGLSLRARVTLDPGPAMPGEPGLAAGRGAPSTPSAELFGPATRHGQQGLGALDSAPAPLAGPQADADAGRSRWSVARPDVYSIRHTTVEDYAHPIAHEIKVRRADLLADLRRPAKGEAYRFISAECWYVLAEGVGTVDDIPPAYGVMLAPGAGPLEVLRPAPRRPMRVPFSIWMALARATPDPQDDEAQAPLAGADATGPPGALPDPSPDAAPPPPVPPET